MAEDVGDVEVHSYKVFKLSISASTCSTLSLQSNKNLSPKTLQGTKVQLSKPLITLAKMPRPTW